jgi:spermidine/putrescine-binding protein
MAEEQRETLRAFGSFGSPISRRTMLRVSAGAALGLGLTPTLLAACGRDDEGGAATSGQGAEPIGTENVGGALDFFWYEGYDMLDIGPMTTWMEENDVTMNSSYISANADVIAKLQRPAGVTWDLVGTFNGLAQPLAEHVRPIDPSEVPLSDKIHPTFADERFFKTEDGDWILVPFTWGRSVSNYLPDKVDPPQSWHDLLKPEYEGHVGWGGGPDGGMVIAGHALGIESTPLYNRDEFEEVLGFLRAMREQVPAVGMSFGDVAELMASGDVWLTYNGWEPVAAWAGDRGAEVANAEPKEGGIGWVEAYGIPTISENAPTALAFINEVLEPETQAAIATTIQVAAVNLDAVEHMDEATAGLYDYENLDSALEKSPLTPFPPEETTDEVVGYSEWLDEWSKLTAGA